MKTKHTEGKWESSTFELGSNTDEAATIWRTHEVEGEAVSTLIASVSKSPGLEEAKSNAKLIASAPKLLQTCKDLIILITPYLKERNYIGDGGEIQEGFNQAKEAIKSAS